MNAAVNAQIVSPSPVLAPLTSNWGNGTNWAVAALVEIDDELISAIARAHEILDLNPRFNRIELNHPFLTLPGSDNDDRRREGMSEADEEAISAVESEVWDPAFAPRVASAAEADIFQRRDAFSVQYNRIIVYRDSAPRLLCAEKYEGEEFESPEIPQLMPPALRARIEARSTWRDAA